MHTHLQVGRLKWNDPSKHLKGFSFIFFQFKLFYLACLYKKYRSDVGLYSPIAPPELSRPLSLSLSLPPSLPPSLLSILVNLLHSWCFTIIPLCVVLLTESGIDSCSSISEEPLTSDLDNRSLGPRGSLPSSSSSRIRGKHTMTVSAVIKLDHDTSDPVYSVIR